MLPDLDMSIERRIGDDNSIRSILVLHTPWIGYRRNESSNAESLYHAKRLIDTHNSDTIEMDITITPDSVDAVNKKSTESEPVIPDAYNNLGIYSSNNETLYAKGFQTSRVLYYERGDKVYCVGFLIQVVRYGKYENLDGEGGGVDPNSVDDNTIKSHVLLKLFDPISSGLLTTRVSVDGSIVTNNIQSLLPEWSYWNRMSSYKFNYKLPFLHFLMSGITNQNRLVVSTPNMYGTKYSINGTGYDVVIWRGKDGIGGLPNTPYIPGYNTTYDFISGVNNIPSITLPLISVEPDTYMFNLSLLDSTDGGRTMMSTSSNSVGMRLRIADFRRSGLDISSIDFTYTIYPEQSLYVRGSSVHRDRVLSLVDTRGTTISFQQGGTGSTGGNGGNTGEGGTTGGTTGGSGGDSDVVDGPSLPSSGVSSGVSTSTDDELNQDNL